MTPQVRSARAERGGHEGCPPPPPASGHGALSSSSSMGDSAPAQVPVDAERVRIAFHEAGHAAANLVHGITPELVSIRSAERWAGVCITDNPLWGISPPDENDLVSAATIPALPEPFRRTFEIDAICSLAGPACERLAVPIEGYMAISDDEMAALRAAVVLTDTEKALLKGGDDVEREPVRSDYENAKRNSWVLAGSDLA